MRLLSRLLAAVDRYAVTNPLLGFAPRPHATGLPSVPAPRGGDWDRALVTELLEG
ncbi:hypothetical protein QDR37_02480 [Amnibacterium sp. CER49]|uniref:hypothetical protein n=1 Tax=Amnibacterium sp. CER49 TaxID=3039161 RepID=UPI002446CD69|nr:hypothetical protein [Amnibacterium sp. CER49]MDH2442804.1 hypothetical protein [Amnibacterium sp. CER49]